MYYFQVADCRHVWEYSMYFRFLETEAKTVWTAFKVTLYIKIIKLCNIIMYILCLYMMLTDFTFVAAFSNIGYTEENTSKN